LLEEARSLGRDGGRAGGRVYVDHDAIIIPHLVPHCLHIIIIIIIIIIQEWMRVRVRVRVGR